METGGSFPSDQNPRNVGYIEDADGSGIYDDPAHGDFTILTIKVRNGRISDCRFLTRCCGAAVAAFSALTEMAQGKTLEEAQQISAESITLALGGLPPDKLHCSQMAVATLQAAIADYRKRHRIDLHDWRALYQRP